jgi:hypothetical protein
MTGREPGASGSPADAAARGSSVLVLVAVPVLTVALVVGLVTGLALRRSTAGGDGDGHPMAAGATVTLEELAPAIAEHYRQADAHRSEYSEIPCFCGCEEFLAHRHLYDCFVRADGDGYDAHASGCGVCIGESATAHELLTAGTEPDAVAAAVIAQFGSTPTTVPPPRD